MEKEDIISKIKAILAKNTDNGASVEESMNAISKAKKLMEKYAITMEDIKTNKIKNSDFEFKYVKEQKKVSSLELIIGKAIADYTGTMCFTYKFGKNNNKIVFFGLKADTELATFIIESCKQSVYNEWMMFKAKNKDVTTTDKGAFNVGFASKIVERLKSFIEEETVTTGKELIVLKNQLVLQNFKERSKNVNFTNNQVVSYKKNVDAEYNGYISGDKAILNKQTETEKHIMIAKG